MFSSMMIAAAPTKAPNSVPMPPAMAISTPSTDCASATVDGETYAVPYYAGSKYIFYRKDLFEKAGLEVPTTLDEFVQAAVTLKQENPKPANFSGFWFPGQDWRRVEADQGRASTPAAR